MAANFKRFDKALEIYSGKLNNVRSLFSNDASKEEIECSYEYTDHERAVLES